MDRNAPKLVGTRIRQIRLRNRIPQAELARRVKVSASYLNLIEHNRRRIGGKLLNEIAQALETDPELLSDGAETSVLQGLQTAIVGLQTPTQSEPINDFAERFPGWSGVVIEQANRITDLEKTVGALSDRLTHDPHLAASLHEIISTVTAIRSSASILTETPDIEPQWQGRFQRNILEESERLVEGARRLSAFLSPDPETDQSTRPPQEEFEIFLANNNHTFPDIADGSVDPDQMIAASQAFTTQSARFIAEKYLDRYRQDFQDLPEDRLTTAMEEFDDDPIRVSQSLGLSLSQVLRRLAQHSDTTPDRGQAGLAICDGSGALTFAKPTDGFSMPRLGNACPLWPIYHALSRPNQPLRQIVEMPGNPEQLFLIYAICETTLPHGFLGPTVSEATMLVLPTREAGQQTILAGSSCTVCPRDACPARREASILSSGL